MVYGNSGTTAEKSEHPVLLQQALLRKDYVMLNMKSHLVRDVESHSALVNIFIVVLTLRRAAAAVSYQGLEHIFEADSYDG